MKKFLKVLVLAFTTMTAGMLLTACGGLTQKTDEPTKEPTDQIIGDTTDKTDGKIGETADETTTSEVKESYAVVFNDEDGRNIVTQPIRHGATAYNIMLTREGHTFQGWYLNGKKFDFSTPITEDIVLCATWKVAVYTVTFDANDASPTFTAQIEHGQNAINIIPATREGYTFRYWCLNDAEFDFDTPITGDVTLSAKWQGVPRTVTFDARGGSLVDSDGTVQIANGDQLIAAPTATRTGYEFDGWFTDSACTKVFDLEKPVTVDVVLYAKWQIKTYTVTFDTDDGNQAVTRNVVYNHKVENITVSRIDYQFLGWYLNGKKFDFETPITEDIILRANWELEFAARFEYRLVADGKSYEITRYNGSGVSEIVLPSEYHGLPVTSITSPYTLVEMQNMAVPYTVYGPFIDYIQDENEAKIINNHPEVTSIVIPDGYTKIGFVAFLGFDSLTSVTIADTVTEIDWGAFHACTNLAMVAFGENSQLTGIGDLAFNFCSELTTFMIPAGVTNIGSNAFYDCTSLASIMFGENSQMTSIGDWAFAGCTAVSSIEISNSVTLIGARAFDGWTSEQTIIFADGTVTNDWNENWNANCNAKILGIQITPSSPSSPDSPEIQSESAEWVLPVDHDAGVILKAADFDMPQFNATTKWYEFDLGYTLGAEAGTKVVACYDGEVTSVIESGDASTGKLIRIKHADGVETVYSSLDEITVAVGDKVKSGDQIGTVGNTANYETFEMPHVRLMTYKDGKPVNPENFIEFDLPTAQGVQVDPEWRNYKNAVDRYNDTVWRELRDLSWRLAIWHEVSLLNGAEAEEYLHNHGHSTMDELEAQIKAQWVDLVSAYNANIRGQKPVNKYADPRSILAVYLPIIEYNMTDKFAEAMTVAEIHTAIINDNPNSGCVVVNLLIDADGVLDETASVYCMVDWSAYGPMYQERMRGVANIYQESVTQLKGYAELLQDLYGIECQGGIHYFLNYPTAQNSFYQHAQVENYILLANSYWGEDGIVVDGETVYYPYEGTTYVG